MLVLSRKLGERIRIGEDIVIIVSEIMPGRVRLGIEAPKDVKILREELEGERDGLPGSKGRHSSQHR